MGEAFNALPAGVVADLLKPENAAKLQDILWYHVLKGTTHAKDLTDGETLTTMEGGKLDATVNSTGVFINNAQVTTADVDASNGVVHIIDAVLLPAAPKAPTPAPAPTPTIKTIIDIAEATPELSTLVFAVSAAGLVETLESPGPFTVFAPTNEAFGALPAGVIANLLKPENKAQLTDVLTYHVVANAAVHSKDLSDGQTIKTVEGHTLLATVNSTGVFINSAQVTTADVDASNGVVHIIDAVLLPQA